ncbi:MAG: hypothetical protein NPIRA01_03220 [Nitrospirales bacterium]|nr:MAG: hypothetical protein NPIRA01_03220 [Nitrospirales bacterium]
MLVLDNPNDLWKVTWELLRVGYDPPTGWLAGGMFAWRTAAKPLTILPQYTVWDLNDQIHKDPTLQVLDVRQPGEWDAGHIGKAAFISGSELPHRFEEIDRKRPVAVVCGSGYRSSVSASLLQHHGHQQVFNVIGGMSAWKTADLPLEKG